MNGNPGRRSNVVIDPVRVVPALTGKVGVDGLKFKVSFARASGKTIVNYHYDFTLHPLSEIIEQYLLEDAEEVTAGTINNRCACLRLIGEFMEGVGARDLNPSVLRKFTLWLAGSMRPTGVRRFSGSSSSVYISNAVRLYESGLCQGRSGWTQRDLDLIVNLADDMQRGSTKRASQESVDKALSAETYTDLVKALTLELEQCRNILAQRESGERTTLYNFDERFSAVIDPNPFVVFSGYAALRFGLRASELNALTPGDIRVDPDYGNHCLYVHAPDKADDYIPVDNTFLEVLRAYPKTRG